MKEMNLESLVILHRDFLHAVKHNDMGPKALLPPPKEDILQIFTTLKNPLPPPGLNLQTSGPMARMLTITPPR
jgi:hypothetical protein